MLVLIFAITDDICLTSPVGQEITKGPGKVVQAIENLGGNEEVPARSDEQGQDVVRAWGKEVGDSDDV